MVCPDRPKGNFFLEFKNHDPKEVRKFTIKEVVFVFIILAIQKINDTMINRREDELTWNDKR